jgi:hypothetical protein
MLDQRCSYGDTLMNVRIIATQNCSHYRTLEHELKDLAIVYELLFVEDHPEIVQRYNIRHSPNLVVDDEVVFRRSPTEGELRALFARS